MHVYVRSEPDPTSVSEFVEQNLSRKGSDLDINLSLNRIIQLRLSSQAFELISTKQTNTR